MLTQFSHSRVFVLALLFTVQSGFSQGTAFTYQGRLNAGGSPANGTYDLALALYNDPLFGSQQGQALTNSAVAVSNGLFTTMVDFGSAAFNGQALWLQILVRSNAVGAFTPLSPRQPLSPTPYAMSAQAVTGPVNSAQLTGTLPNATLPANLTLSGTITAGSFVGNGAGLTGLNANNLSAGTVPLAQLPGTVLTNGAGGVSLAGSFTGNGAGITNVSLNSVSITQFTNWLVGWGNNSYGQAAPPAAASNVVAAAGGNYFSVGLRSDGTVLAWGDNLDNETSVPADLSNVTAIAAGSVHSLALKRDGTVVAWGWNGSGQTNVPAGLANVVAIAAGDSHSLALKADGTVIGWGYNGYGQISVPTGLTNVVAIASGYAHCLALRADGTVLGWGSNGSGQTNVPAGLTNVVAISAGGYHNLALKADGTVLGWGFNYYGQTNVPAGLSNVVAVSCSSYSSLALKSDGTLAVWGDNSYGEANLPLGLGHVAALSCVPTALHFLVLEKQPLTAVALLNTDNTFSGNLSAGIISAGIISAGIISGSLRLNDTNLWLRGGTDVNHGLGWYGSGKTFGSLAPDGPVLFGYGGGALGTTVSGANPVLVWGPSSVTVNGTLNANNLNVSAALTANGSSLTNLNAAQLATGTLPAGRLAGTYNNALTLSHPNNSFTGFFTVATNGNLHLNDRPLYLRPDQNHGLVYSGNGLTNFGSGNAQVDGPVLWGFSGGALGVLAGGAHPVLTWTNGGVQVNGGFSYSSDRNLKTDFVPVDSEHILSAVSSLPILTWSYKSDTAARHVGPTAQEFHQAFSVNGADDTHINIGDEAGVALAAIQALNKKLQERDALIEQLSRRLEALEAKQGTR